MSNAAGLVRDVSKALFLNEASLAVQMRFLRESDVVPTGGRGKGGFAMRPKDAASLLIAAAVTSTIKDTAEMTKAFMQLPMRYRDVRGPSRPLQWIQSGGTLPGLEQDTVIRKFGLGRVPDSATFQEGLETVIELFVRNVVFPKLVPEDFAQPPGPELNLEYRHSLSVRFFLPLPCATISYFADRILRESLSFGGVGSAVNTGSYDDVLARADMQGCLTQYRVVNDLALRKIAKSVGEEGLRSALSSPPPPRKTRSRAKSKRISKK